MVATQTKKNERNTQRFHEAGFHVILSSVNNMLGLQTISLKEMAVPRNLRSATASACWSALQAATPA